MLIKLTPPLRLSKKFSASIASIINEKLENIRYNSCNLLKCTKTTFKVDPFLPVQIPKVLDTTKLSASRQVYIIFFIFERVELDIN